MRPVSERVLRGFLRFRQGGRLISGWRRIVCSGVVGWTLAETDLEGGNRRWHGEQGDADGDGGKHEGMAATDVAEHITGYGWLVCRSLFQ